jgi:5-methyltetrahydropteroyltriglutamate--homocysteine methyltransferase
MANIPLFPVTVVGSWPRSNDLVRALRSKEAGETTLAEFNSVADGEVLDCIRAQEEAGVDILSDGEQRRDNFYSFAVDKLNGMQLMKVSELLNYSADRARMEEVLRALDVPAFAIKSPIAIDILSKRQGLALDELAFLREHTDRAIKIPIPGPYMLTRSAWFEGLSDKAYPTPDDLAKDVVALLREEIIALRDSGCDFVQLDEPTLSQVVFGEETTETFMCAALPNRRDPTDELEMAVRLMNETLDGITGIKTGVHVCRGNWSRKEEVLLTGNYGPMLPYLVQMNVDQLVLECATPRAGEMDVFKEYSNEKEIGLGVVNPRTDEIEPPEQIVARVKELLKYFDPDKIYLNPDCGFGTFAERNVNTHAIAIEKMKTITKAAQLLRAEYA